MADRKFREQVSAADFQFIPNGQEPDPTGVLTALAEVRSIIDRRAGE